MKLVVLLNILKLDKDITEKLQISISHEHNVQTFKTKYYHTHPTTHVGWVLWHRGLSQWSRCPIPY